MLCIHVCLSRSRLCHAFCPLWACAYWFLGPLACVVASIPLMACLDATTCENKSQWCRFLIHTLSPFRAMLWLPCLLYATHLAFFAFLHFLHACLEVHAWVCVSSMLQSHGTMDTRSKPTFVLLRHPLLFNNIFVCPPLVSLWYFIL